MDITLKNDNILNDYYNKINELIIKAKQNVRKNINYEIIKTFSNKLTHEFRRGYSIPS